MQESCATLKRVSDDGQDVRNQQKEIDGHVGRNRYRVAHEFELPDTTASKGVARHLKVLERIVQDISAGVYTVLVVAHSSRLDRRGVAHQMLWLLQVEMAGGRIESVREPHFGRTDKMSRAMTVFSQDDNFEYSNTLSMNVRAANAVVDETGMFRGRPLWGYLSLCTLCGQVNRDKSGCKHRKTKRMALDPVLAPVVREAFRRIAAGQSVPRVCAWLLEKHAITRTRSGITLAVRNPDYWTGRYEITDHEGKVWVHKTDPLISHDIWAAANASLDSRPATAPRARRARRADFSGSVWCGTCGGVAYRHWYGARMNPETGVQVKRRVYYCKACPATSWHADAADREIERTMSNDGSPEMEMRIIIPPDNRRERLNAVNDALRNLAARNLPEDEEDRIRAELRAERTEIMAAPLPDDAPRREPVFTGRSRGEAWKAMSHLERVAYLRSGDVMVFLKGHNADVVVDAVYPEA